MKYHLHMSGQDCLLLKLDIVCQHLCGLCWKSWFLVKIVWCWLLISCLVNALHVSGEISVEVYKFESKFNRKVVFQPTTLGHELVHWSRKILRGLGNAAAAHRFKPGVQTQFKEYRQYLPFASNVQQCNDWFVFIWRTQVLAFGGRAFDDACADKARYVRVQSRSRNVAPSLVIYGVGIVGHCIRICSPT